MRFGSLLWLWIAAAIPILMVGWFYLRRLLTSRRVAALVGGPMAARLYVSGDPFRIRLKFILFTATLSLLALTMARPLGGLKDPAANESSGLDVVLLIDVSRSMLVQDGDPDRLHLAVAAMSDLLDSMGGDRIAAIVFKGQANLVAPLTFDKQAVRLVLENLSPDMIGEPGTNIGEALVMAAERFGPKDKNPRAVIIISDGENLEGDPVFAARTAALAGLRIFTAGVGSADGGKVPAPIKKTRRDGEKPEPFVRSQGREVVSKLDESMLRRIALAGAGEYVHITQETDLADLYREKIESLSGNTLSGDLADFEDLSYIPLMIALSTLIACLVLRVRPARSSALRRSLVAALAALAIGMGNLHADATRDFITQARTLLDESPGEAVAVLQDAVIRAPEEPALIYNYAIALHAAGDYASADQSWRRLSLEFPDYLPGRVAFARSNTNHRIAEAAMRTRDFDGAAIHFRESLLLQEVAASAGGVTPRDIETNRALTTAQLNGVLRQAAQKFRDEAQRDLERNRSNLAERAMEQYQSAVARIDEAADILPDDPATVSARTEIRNEFAQLMASMASEQEALAADSLAGIPENQRKSGNPREKGTYENLSDAAALLTQADEMAVGENDYRLAGRRSRSKTRRSA